LGLSIYLGPPERLRHRIRRGIRISDHRIPLLESGNPFYDEVIRERWARIERDGLQYRTILVEDPE
jgi:hypothetical protein